MNIVNRASLGREKLDARNYTASADPKRKGGRTQNWIQLYVGKMQRLNVQTDGDLKIVIIGDKTVENDYWSVPYREVAALLREDAVRSPSRKNAKSPHWMIQIKKLHQFTVFRGIGNGTSAVDVQRCYGVPL